ncbi:MAG: hypothetical protein ACFFCE_05755 [Promethearchaeota archaeon]
MNEEEFNYKKILEKMISEASKDPAKARSYINIFPLYARLYVEPYLTTEDKKFAVNYKKITKKLVPKQKEILQSFLQPGMTMVFGCRKTGKTYLDALGIILLGTRRKLRVHILSSKKETASYVISSIREIDLEYKLDLLGKQDAKTHTTLKNGTTVMAHSNTIADTGTYEADIVIIDEAQEVEPEVWSKIFPMLATGREMHIWITGTAKAGSRFHTFWFDKDLQCSKFTLRKEDAIWVSEDTWKQIKAGMTERMWRQEVLMEWVEEEGAYFKAKKIEEAFVDYNEIGNYGEIVCPIDWGWGHECTMFVLAIKNNIIYELESWGKQNATYEEILVKCREFQQKYHPLFILEGSQTIASVVNSKMKKSNYSTKFSFFGNQKEWYIEGLRYVLDENRLIVKNPTLKQQLLHYCGDKKDDDYVDSLMHGVYYYFRKYLWEMYSNWNYGG